MTAVVLPPRHSRKRLIVPFAIVGVLLAAWTGWWFVLAQQVETRLDAQVQALRADGWTVQYGDTGVSGWPFRTRIEFPHARVVAPSGHGLAAPTLIAEANAYNPDKWMLIAPEGVILSRADKGQVAIDSKAIRLSISHLRARFPDVRLELAEPTFNAHPGAEAFPLSSAKRVEVYARPNLRQAAGPDEVDVLFRLIDARGRPDGPVEGVTRAGMLTLEAEGVIEHASRLRGADNAGVFAAWSRAGGRFRDIRGELSAGDSRAQLSSDVLAAGPDGRLVGEVSFQAEKPMAALGGLAASRSGSVNRMGAAGAAAAAAVTGDRDASLTIRFENGRTWLGPFALAPAPKLF